MKEKLAELRQRLREINDLGRITSVLSWDQSTYMPPRGAAARGRQMALLGRLGHERSTDPELGRLIDDLEPLTANLPYDDNDAALVRVARRDFDQATKVPADLVAAFYAHGAESYAVWTAARPDNDFDAVLPYLEKSLDFSRQLADCFPGYDHIADPLIDFSDYGMKAESIRSLFDPLRRELVPLVEAIADQPPADDSFLKKHYPEAAQLAFGKEVVEAFGYDFSRGRQDKTPHPFMTKFGHDDVRITTRVKENDLNEALFSTLHEAGHALYELGTDDDLAGTPLDSGTSAGVHESQSRLWENQVGRSRPFWEHYYPRLQAQFPEQLKGVSLDDFYRAINKVQRSLIRTDADEVTYNLHVMLRFDLELAMLEGELAVKDLPEAWHGRYESDLGVRAPSHVDGVLQDVHWYGGTVGGSFQGYTLGNVMSALFYQSALDAHPDIPAQIARGEFETLHGWMRENIYRHGRKFTAPELIERVTGGPLVIEPYIAYLRDKFGVLYNI